MPIITNIYHWRNSHKVLYLRDIFGRDGGVPQPIPLCEPCIVGSRFLSHLRIERCALLLLLANLLLNQANLANKHGYFTLLDGPLHFSTTCSDWAT